MKWMCPLLLSLGLAGGFHASAAPVTLTEVVETMMEAQANEALFIGTTFGVDNASAIRFSANVDLDTRSFAFSTLDNQSFLGQAFSLTTTGAFDQTLGAYHWTSTGTFGAQAWTSVGSVEWIGDPTGTVETTATIGNVTVKVKGEVSWEQGPVNALSSGNYSLESDNGTKWGPFSGRDRFDVISQEWIHTISVGPSNFVPNGILTVSSGALGSGGDGNFDMRIRALPEPSTIVLLLAALFACHLSSARKSA